MCRTIRLSIGLLLALVIGIGCRDANSTPASPPVESALAPPPTVTVAPSLPELPEPIGADSLLLIFVAPRVEAMEVQPLIDSLTDKANMPIEIRLSARYAEAYEALCNGTAALATLDAFGYLAASEAGCGETLYQLEKDGERAAQTQLVAEANRIFSITNFYNRTFCRVGPPSAAGWIVPAMALRAAGIDPFADLKGVVEAGDDRAVLEMILARQCDAGATALGAEAALEDPAAIDVIEVLPPVPYDVLVVSTRLENGARAALEDFLRLNRDQVAAVHGAGALRDPDDELFNPLRLLAEAAGVDIRALTD